MDVEMSDVKPENETEGTLDAVMINAETNIAKPFVLKPKEEDAHNPISSDVETQSTLLGISESSKPKVDDDLGDVFDLNLQDDAMKISPPGTTLLTSREDGIVAVILVKEGTKVEKDDPLFILNLKEEFKISDVDEEEEEEEEDDDDTLSTDSNTRDATQETKGEWELVSPGDLRPGEEFRVRFHDREAFYRYCSENKIDMGNFEDHFRLYLDYKSRMNEDIETIRRCKARSADSDHSRVNSELTVSESADSEIEDLHWSSPEYSEMQAVFNKMYPDCDLSKVIDPHVVYVALYSFQVIEVLVQEGNEVKRFQPLLVKIDI